MVAGGGTRRTPGILTRSKGAIVEGLLTIVTSGVV